MVREGSRVCALHDIGRNAFSELAEAYVEKHVAVRCKPKTESMYRLVVAKYTLPEFGRRPALAVAGGVSAWAAAG